MKLGTLLLFCGIVAACATTYSQPNTSEQFATAEFQKSYGDHNYAGQVLSQGRQQFFFNLAGSGCTEPERIAIFATGSIGGNAVRKRIAAGQEIILASVVNIRDVAPTAYTKVDPSSDIDVNHCLSVARFTPEEGNNYAVKMELTTLNDCILLIENTDNTSSFENENVCSPDELSNLIGTLRSQYPVLK